MRPEQLATKEHPIRCSKMASLPKCSMRLLLMLESDDEDDIGGAPAQTGSLTHVGVAAFHKELGTLAQKRKAAWDAIASHAEKFPLAEENEVRLFITPYMDDPRNIEAEFVFIKGQPAVEVPVQFTLSPHELDHTGQDVHIEGTLDQIRIWNKVPVTMDLKTGKKTGWEMIHDYALQLCGYTHGAREYLDIKDCQPGAIIRNRGYRTRENNDVSPDGVFFFLPWNYETCLTLLESIRLDVALFRNGYIEFGPGPHCTYCEHGGLSGCVPKYENLVKLGFIK